MDSVVYGCTDGSKVRQYRSILTITLTLRDRAPGKGKGNGRQGRKGKMKGEGGRKEGKGRELCLTRNRSLANSIKAIIHCCISMMTQQHLACAH